MAISPLIAGARDSSQLSMVPKWTRFDQSFQSSVAYSSPLQDCTLKVEFHSPLGETNVVYGFWDGGKTWRVRFLPDQPGRWTFRTTCSDLQNEGLQHQSGAFLCVAPAPTDSNRFAKHGPIRVARDRRHFEHQDGTPFFWMADIVWDGARLSTPKDWGFYAQVRAAQKFTASQFSIVPGKDFHGGAAFGDRSRIIPNVEFFQQLDAKMATLNRAGLLCVIAPLWNRDRQYFDPLPERQKLLLLRYMVARWGGDNAAWLLHCEDATLEEIALWQRIGRDLFAGTHSGPALLTVPERLRLFSQFRDDDAISGVGYPSTMRPAAVKELLTAPLERPLIKITAAEENKKRSGASERITANDIRAETWASLLNVSTAGACYSSEAVAAWDATIDRNIPGDLPLWQKSLFLPGAKQMTVVADLFNAIPFWKLKPVPEAAGLRLKASGDSRSSAQTESKNLGLFYTREPTLELPLNTLPHLPILTWLDPRTGRTNRAVAVVGPQSFKFPIPDPGDWVLIVGSSSREKSPP